MNTLWTILGALVILNIIVVAHELGHFLTARALKIPVLEFAVGMGPKVWGRKGKKGTEFALRALPIGGSCRFMGEDDGDFAAEGALNNQPAWKRFLTIFAGPLANIVLVIALLIGFYAIYGIDVAVPNVPEISSVTEGSPAAQSGMMPGDKILEIDGEAIPDGANGTSLFSERVQQPGDIPLTVERAGERAALTIAGRDEEGGVYRVGVTIGPSVVNQRQSIGMCVKYAFLMTGQNLTVMVDGLRNMIFRGEGLGEVKGVVGIVDEAAASIEQAGQYHMTPMMMAFNWLVLISLNLGIMNLLPIPALDGGRLLIIFVEMIVRKPLKPEIEAYIHAGGFVLLMGLILVVTYRDIANIVTRTFGGG